MGGLFDSVAVWCPAEVGCSVPILTVVITRVCRKKEQFVVVYRKTMNDLVGTRPI